MNTLFDLPPVWMAPMAGEAADAGLVALVPLISPYQAARERARALHQAAGVPFLEVYVDTPIEAVSYTHLTLPTICSV